MLRHLWRSYKCLLRHRDLIFATFLCTNLHEPFFERLSNCVGSNEKKSFLCPGVHAILNVRWCKKILKDASISRYVTRRSRIISSRTTSMFSETTAVFGWLLRNSSFSKRRPQLNSLHQLFTVLYDGALSPNKGLSSSMHSCRDNPRR